MTRTQLASWQSLTALAEQHQSFSIADAFSHDSDRFERYHIELDNLLFDYSKNQVNQEILESLIQLARDCQIEQIRTKMFSGEKINHTENRAVLHTALRSQSNQPLYVDGVDIRVQIQHELCKIKHLVERIHQAQFLGYSDKPIADVVHIGIGGSNLGPEMATQALSHCAVENIKVHYVSNVDGQQINQVLATLNPETTLFIVASKTFTTSETMLNATTAKSWLTNHFQSNQAIARHFIAISSNTEQVCAFGIQPNNIFSMWDWVGGRFSIWSVIGLPLAIAIGYDHFHEFLTGGNAIDEHFLSAPLEQNVPVIMALLSTWHATFLGHQHQVILPYDQALSRFPAYLQQAEMESNGKSVNNSGEPLGYPSVAALWGESGINGQHAFYQFLHQSQQKVPADFIGSVNNSFSVNKHHQTLLANFFAQSQGLMQGNSENNVYQQLIDEGHSPISAQRLTSHKVHPGSKPSNTLLFDEITPYSLGQLVSIYEHKIFCQAVILDINAFDQWGVELGKTLAKSIECNIEHREIDEQLDASTRGLLRYFLKKQRNL